MAVMLTNEIGFIGGDPEIVETKNGQLRKFRMAINKTYKRDDGADWFNVEDWDGVGERLWPHLKKGSAVKITGRLSFGEYKTNSGETREDKRIRLLAIDFAPSSGRRDDDDNAGGGTASADVPW